ncbi:MAG TPA: hypothetical protein ENG87_04890 [Candidatus Pacearchaeota archaeon]|nr:hypothetical protein [Candidatus Pacearchaeota archaeon]HDZ61437.1 hypothetical protein [Candidatus Pacearchaeota archaeon]
MEIQDIFIRKKIFGGFVLILFIVGLFLYGNLTYGEKFLEYSWWIISFNLLLLVTFAISWFRDRAHSDDKEIQTTISSEMNSKLKDEINEKDIKKKLKIHEDIRELFTLNQVFPKDVLLKSIMRSILYSFSYILLFLIGEGWINQKIFSDVFVANFIFIFLFLGSIYYLLKGLINIAFFFKS